MLEHTMKIFEIYFIIFKMQFAFMPVSGNIDVIFIVCKLQQKYFGNEKNLYFNFIDLGKACSRVPRGIARWAMRKLNVDGWLIEATMAI